MSSQKPDLVSFFFYLGSIGLADTAAGRPATAADHFVCRCQQGLRRAQGLR
jgi:hypothetical protein